MTLLEGQHIGLVSLNDPINTTTAQGRLVFRIFASLAEFDRTGEPAGGDSGADPSWTCFRPSTGSITGSS
ncbi:recombinase family protein [Spirosoma gilvum]